MSKIRPFTEKDAPVVAEMIADSFEFAEELDSIFIAKALEEVVFQNPWADESMPSLVYEHTDGTVRGFMGVSPRTMEFKGEQIRVGILHNFVVEPGIHAAIAGTKLIRSMFDGPQDLVISGSSGDASKFFTKKTGGVTGYLYSFGWKLQIRPLQSGLNYLGSRWKTSGLPRILKPAAKTGDLLIRNLIGFPVRPRRPSGRMFQLTAGEVVKYQREFSKDRLLKPDYTPETFKWVIDTAGKARQLGEIQMIGVSNERGNFAGWFIYYLKKGGRCEVLQIQSKNGKEQIVLDFLIYHAWKRGGAELVGRIEPGFMRALSNTWSLVVPGRMWMLLFSQNPEISSAICRGEAFISRLEDDLWLL